MKAIIISIGTELTTGETVDTNAAWLSQQMAEIGVSVLMHVVVPDELESIRRALAEACALAEVVLVSGGLGPTVDDLTRQALAAAMGVELELRAEQVEAIRAFFAARCRPMPDANLVQAEFPVGSEALGNTCGTAPGIRATLKKATVWIMPGVPREMQVMFKREVLPVLMPRAGSAVLLSKVIWCYGAGESQIGELIVDLMRRGRNPTVGTTAQQTVIGVRIHAHGQTRAEAERLLAETADEVRRRLGRLVFGEDEDTLAEAVARLLTRQGKTVSTAESCTAGLIAKSLTDVAGSSAYFLEGVVSYSNAAKTRLLRVPAEAIARHGAVSREVAEAMAVNCRRLSGSDYGIGVTGIAGPTGGAPDKPVGLVYIGLADAGGCQVTEHLLGDQLTRCEVRDRTHKVALNRLRLRLLEEADGSASCQPAAPA